MILTTDDLRKYVVDDSSKSIDDIKEAINKDFGITKIGDLKSKLEKEYGIDGKKSSYTDFENVSKNDMIKSLSEKKEKSYVETN